MSQEIVGRHVSIDAWSCPTDLLDDPIYIRQAVIDATAAGRGMLLHISERALESLQASLKPKRVRNSRAKRGIDPATQPAIPRVDSPVPQRAP